ncbi:MAG: ATP synthase F1 subunit gamma [Dehalococcoidia bacterium]
MPSTKDLRDRIRSVSNTAKVTGAMQMIAASKMTRAQNMVTNSRPYFETIHKMLTKVTNSSNNEEMLSEVKLLSAREVKKTLVLFITPDRGLAGALVGNLTKAINEFISQNKSEISFITVGKKGDRYLSRSTRNLFGKFTVSDRPTFDETIPISNTIIENYENENFDKVVLIYAKFVNTAVQHIQAHQVLPIKREDKEDNPKDYIFEPELISLLKSIAPKYVENQVFHAVLEAFASEHSARMVAMQNATDNANELVEGLTLDLNKARQESITGELLDIVGGVAALEK